MKKAFVFFVFVLSACQLPIERKIPMTVDAYLNEKPPVKTAVIQLMNKSVAKEDIEYRQFFKKLKPVLEEKGYKIVPASEKAAVVLRLKFGSESSGFNRTRSAVDTAEFNHPVDEPAPRLTSVTGKVTLYKKYISLTAADAKNTKNQYWKVTVSKEDDAPDFRSAEDMLLYLLSHFIEKESGRLISADMSDIEYYQRHVLGYSPAEASPFFVVEPEVRRQYIKELQIKVNAHALDFKKCGLNEIRQVSFMVSPFGTLPTFQLKEAFDIMGAPVPENVRKCIALHFEPLLEVPVGIDTTQPLTVRIPVR